MLIWSEDRWNPCPPETVGVDVNLVGSPMMYLPNGYLWLDVNTSEDLRSYPRPKIVDIDVSDVGRSMLIRRLPGYGDRRLLMLVLTLLGRTSRMSWGFGALPMMLRHWRKILLGMIEELQWCWSDDYQAMTALWARPRPSNVFCEKESLRQGMYV